MGLGRRGRRKAGRPSVSGAPLFPAPHFDPDRKGEVQGRGPGDPGHRPPASVPAWIRSQQSEVGGKWSGGGGGQLSTAAFHSVPFCPLTAWMQPGASPSRRGKETPQQKMRGALGLEGKGLPAKVEAEPVRDPSGHKLFRIQQGEPQPGAKGRLPSPTGFTQLLPLREAGWAGGRRRNQSPNSFLQRGRKLPREVENYCIRLDLI